MKKYYFSTVSVLILILSLIGFSDNLITDVGQESNSDPKFIIHGLFCFAWMFLFVIQTNYIRKGNYKAHKQLGIAGVITAIGVVVSTWYIFFATFEGWDKLIFHAKANRIFMTSYAILIVLGFLNRKQADNHKRLILLATLFMLEPILSRVAGNTGLNALVLTPVIWNAIFISLFVYDWLTAKKIHQITYLGFSWFYLVWIIAIVV